MVQERSRSVKALFCVQRRNPQSIRNDSGACFYNTGGNLLDNKATGGTLQNFQFRIGGRYYPAAPVQCSLTPGSNISNGGSEAYVELSKALNIVGDYRLSSNCSTLNWAATQYGLGVSIGNVPGQQSTLLSSNLPEHDYKPFFFGYGTNGNVLTIMNTDSWGNMPSASFAMAASLETTNGMEISGLNAEEQSDIAVLATWNEAQAANFSLEVYTYYDAMMILRENNVLELIQ